MNIFEGVIDTFIHPELQSGEVFFSNMDARSFVNLAYRTKRRGLVAYDGEGNPQASADWTPVFVKRQELEALELNLVIARREFHKAYRI